MVYNLICIPDNNLTTKTFDGCNFVVVDPNNALDAVCPITVKKLIRVSNLDRDVVDINQEAVAGIVIPSLSSFAAAKNWKLDNPAKLLAVELENDAKKADAFINGLWKQGGNFIDIILSKYPIALGKEPHDVPTIPPHKLAMFVTHQQAYRTAANFAPIGEPNTTVTVNENPPTKFPVWGWVLAGIGILVVIGVVIWLALAYKKKRQQQNYSRKTVP
jgi:hypothetical protein